MTHFILGNMAVTLRFAKLTALISDRSTPHSIRWGIEIQAYCSDLEESCELECVELFRTDVGEIQHCDDLFEKYGEWSGIGATDSDSKATLSIWEHFDIADVTWAFEKGEQGLVQVGFEGKCDLDYEPHFDGTTVISVATTLTWNGFPCRGRSEDESRARLQKMGFLDPTHFEDLGDGVYLRPQHYPRYTEFR